MWEIVTATKRNLSSDCFDGCVPVVITDGLSDWPAMTHWSPATLRSLNSQRAVDVEVSQSGDWNFNPDGTVVDPTSQHRVPNVLFEQATDWITDDNPLGPKYYVMEEINDTLPDLRSDLCFPTVVAPREMKLWFGSAGTGAQLHFDTSNNLFAQIYGSKRFSLFAPDQTSCLYPFPEDCKHYNKSHVDIGQPDLAAFPLYGSANKLIVTIHPGQLLFLPAFWWHHVRSLDISISVNQFFGPWVTQCGGPNALWFLRSAFRRDRWARICKRLSLSRQGLLESAERLLRANSRAAAALAAAAAWDEWTRTAGAGAPTVRQDPDLTKKLDSLALAGLERPDSDISSEDVACLIKRIRRVVDKRDHS